MKELFMVDQNTLIVLVALVVFVVFVVIYKSKQNPTYRDSGDNVYDDSDDRYYDIDKDIEEFTEVKKYSKTKEYKTTSEEAKVWFYIDMTSIFIFGLILYVMVMKRLGILGFFIGDFGISFAIMFVLYFVVIKPVLFKTED